MTEKEKSQQILSKNIINFMKMYSEETCELIKINYWNSTEKKFNESNVEPSEIINLIFSEIFKKNLQIINDNNLTFLIFEFCLLKSNENKDAKENFFIKIFELFDEILQNFEAIFPYVKEYIFEYALFLMEKFEENFPKAEKKIEKFFNDLIEIDFNFFMINFTTYANKISKLLTNKIFEIVFLKFLRNLLQVNLFNNLNFLQNVIFSEKKDKESINKIKAYFLFVEIGIEFFAKNSDKKFNEIGKNFFFEVLKNSFELLKINRNNSEIYNIYQEKFEIFLLNIFENSNIYANLILENDFLLKEIFDENYKNKDKPLNLNGLEAKKVFPFTLLNIFFRVNTYSSMQKMCNLINIFKNNNNTVAEKAIIKIIQKKFFLIGRLKNFKGANNFEINDFKIKSIDDSNINKNSVISSLNIKEINNFQAISNLNLLKYIIENTLITNENKNKEKEIYFNVNILNEILEILFSLKFEDFDRNLKTELFKNLLTFLYVLYENIEGGLDLMDKSNQKIFELIFQNLKNFQPELIINEFYPIIVSFFGTIVLPKIQGLGLKDSYKTNFTASDFKILKHFFEFLRKFAGIDCIANITCKYLQMIINIKGNNLNLKIFALENFVDLVKVKNTAKYYILFFNFVTDNIKSLKTILKNNSNVDNPNSLRIVKEHSNLMNIFLFSLYELTKKFDGPLPSDISNYFYNKFEEFLSKNPEDEFTFEDIICLEGVKYILAKGQSDNLEELYSENILNMKLFKLIDKLFKQQNLKNNNKEYFIGEENAINYMENFHLKSMESSHMPFDFSINLESLFLNNPKDGETNNLNKFFNLQDRNFLRILVLIFLSRSIGNFFGNLIASNRDKFNPKFLAENPNTIYTSIVKSFDYISINLVFINNTEKNFYYLLLLNEILSFPENLNFFISTHSHITSTENVKDLSLFNENNSQIIFEKNKNLFAYCKYKNIGIFYLQKTIKNLISLEVNTLSIIENKIYGNNINSKGENFIVNSIYLNNINNYYDNTAFNNNKNIKSYFLKLFLDSMQDIKEINKEYNRNFYIFCLKERIFLEIFKHCIELINIDVFNICIYNAIKNDIYDSKKMNYLRTVFFDYLIRFSKINKSALQFSLRILSNQNSFNKLYNFNKNLIANEKENLLNFTNDDIEQNIKPIKMEMTISDKLINLLEFNLSSIIVFNSFNPEVLEITKNILDNMKETINSHDENFLINLKNFGKIISNLYQISVGNKKTEILPNCEVNKKLKDSLSHLIKMDYLEFYLEKFLDLENPKVFKYIEKNFMEYMENINIFSNFKKIKLIKENNNEILSVKKFENEEMFKILLMLTDLNIPTYLHNIIKRLIISYKNSNNNMRFLLENYLNFYFSNNTSKKPCVDFIRNFIFSSPCDYELDEKNIKDKDKGIINFYWEDKYKILNYAITNYILEENSLSVKRNKILSQTSENKLNRLEIIKNMIGHLHFSIFLK